jgi:energy-coupling factor transporter ATP-binding protein EcfA2
MNIRITSNPFGEESCEHEIQALGEEYNNYFYREARFNKDVLDVNVYLIVGRRGSGKTSLSKHFENYSIYKNKEFIYIDGAPIYDEAFSNILTQSSYSGDMLTNRAIKIWEYIFWLSIFERFSKYDRLIKDACFFADQEKDFTRLSTEILKHVVSTLIKDDKKTIVEAIEAQFSQMNFIKAQQKVFEIAKSRNVIIAIDTIDRYDKGNETLMSITAGLIECASNFHLRYANQGIHIKAFIAGEIFPTIREVAISNPSKFIRNPLHLHWTPSDLIHLVGWRINKYAQKAGIEIEQVTLDRIGSIKIWDSFFGESITNSLGKPEKFISYILRFTQLRPRQVISFCNEIFNNFEKVNKLPKIETDKLSQLTAKISSEFANDVINSYAKIYPNIGDVLEALRGSPMMFPGRL